MRRDFLKDLGLSMENVPNLKRNELIKYGSTTSTTTFEKGVVVFGRAKAWTEKDFLYDITRGVDFMSNAAKQVAEYWEKIDKKYQAKMFYRDQ